MKKLSYIIIGLICLAYGVLSYKSIISGNNEGVTDLSIYTNAWERFPNTWNTVRGSDYLADHLSPSVYLMTPIYKLGGLTGVIFFVPFLVIFLPLLVLDKAFKLNWYSLLLGGIFLALHPLTQNSLLFGAFHGNSLAPLGFALVNATFQKTRWFYLVYFLTLAVKEDMFLFLNLLLVQLAFWNYLKHRDWKRLVKPTLICLGITLVWFFVFATRETAISYEHANTFSAELTDTRRHVLTHYLIYDLPSFFLGNLSGTANFFYRYFSDYLVNPVFHHGVLMPITTLISYFLFLKRKDEKPTT